VTDGDKGDIVVSDGGQTWRLKTPVKLGAGEAVNPMTGMWETTTSATEASLLRIRQGTYAEPSTSLVPLAKVERIVRATDAALKASGVSMLSDATDNMAAFVSACEAVEGSHAHAVGLVGSGISHGQSISNELHGTFGGGTGVYGVAYTDGPNTFAQGAIFHGKTTHASGNVTAVTLLPGNFSGTDFRYNPAGFSSCALWINANGTADMGAGILVAGFLGRQFEYGIAFPGGGAPGKIGGAKIATLRDDSHSPTVFDINGSHTVGLDTTGATFSGRAILLGDPHSMGWSDVGFVRTGVATVSLVGGAGQASTFFAHLIRAESDAALGEFSGGMFSAGTTQTPSAAGQRIGGLNFRGGGNNGTVSIAAISTEPWTATARGTRLTFGTTANGSTGRFERVWVSEAGVDIRSGGSLLVEGTKVVGARGAAVANATDSASAVTQLNALLERLRAHGLIAS
jgi:hypothetical protein